MRFDPVLAEIRFGYGLSPDLPRPASGDDMLRALAGPDQMAARFPISDFGQVLNRLAGLDVYRSARRKSPGPASKAAYDDARRVLMKQMRADHRFWLTRHLLRRSQTTDALRERLVAFWADHFTAHGKTPESRWAMSAHIETAIRPHVAGRFADLLASAVTSPTMLMYLDQRASRGPDSPAAKRSKRKDGLNENLARELLELHTLGAGGPYTQTDVRQLAELLTGLTFSLTKGTEFRPDMAEPGAETVLGKTYGGGRASMADIDAALEDLATHPATAAHIGRKLAVHFVSDTPDPGLVAALGARFGETGGDLMAVYDVLLSHPAVWDPAPGNIRPPLDWISAAVRALAVPEAALIPDRNRHFLNRLQRGLAQMAQPYERPPGPDGWPEEDTFWLTPQGLAARLQWALREPRRLVSVLPDPRVFVDTALGPRAGDGLRFAAGAAESRADGIGLVLAAPEFQRS